VDVAGIKWQSEQQLKSAQTNATASYLVHTMQKAKFNAQFGDIIAEFIQPQNKQSSSAPVLIK